MDHYEVYRKAFNHQRSKSKLRSNYFSKDIVVEFKFNPKELINFDTIFPYSERTSSKYCNAVNKCIFNGRIF